MSESYIGKVAKMLGVRLEEEFGVENFDGVYKFSEYYLMRLDRQGVWECDNEALGEILNGDSEIIKKPWKPTENEKYFTINYDGTILSERFCSHCSEGLQNIRMGNFFKTYDEAVENIDKYIQYLHQEPDMSWR